jgi:hypothetical protein
MASLCYDINAHLNTLMVDYNTILTGNNLSQRLNFNKMTIKY